ncbi:MAG: ATP-binding protein [Candidatus Kapabacteria bacterium]|nr:ATP-binding protein [Candidatus Kapabacteria bacterium]
MAAICLCGLGLCVFSLSALQGIPQPTPTTNTPRTSTATAEDYMFTRIGLEQGLSQNSVYSLHQDKRGFIWIGTQDGINKFDGYTFIAYRNASAGNIIGSSLRTSATNNAVNSMRGALPNAWIERIIRDKYDNLWISSNGGGLGVIHRDSNVALLMPMLSDAGAASNKGNASVLRSSFVTGLYNDNAGRLWIGTDKGLQCIDTVQPLYHATANNRANVKIRFIADDLRNAALKNVLSGEIRAITGDRFGRLWIAAGNQIFCFDVHPSEQAIERFQEFFITELPLHSTSQTPQTPHQIRNQLPTDFPRQTVIQSLFADSLGRLWIGTLGKGLLLYNPQSHHLRTFPYSSSRDDSPYRINTISGRSVYCFATDERGFLWVGTDNGINIFSQDIYTLRDTANVRIAVCRSVPQIPQSLSDNAVRSLLCDASGTMWVGTLTGGMSLWNPLKERFGRYSPQLGNASFLPYRVVRCFYEENDSTLWIGTDDGVVRWNHVNKNFTQLPLVAKDGYGLQSGRVWAIDRDSAGIFWFCTDGGGLHRYDPRKGSFTVFQNNPNDSASLGNNRVRTMVCDAHGGFWLGTIGGLEYFHPVRKQWRHFRHNPLNPNSISNDRIQWLLLDNDTTLWVATSLGLNKFNPQTQVWKRYFHDSTSSSIANSWVKHIMRDREGNLWAATIDGISRYNSQTDSFENYGVQNGLTNQYVYGILEDSTGTLWMGTDGGLARFDKQNGAFRMYDAADGLQSKEFNTNAFYRMKSGVLLFGGVNGMNMFHPSRLGDRTFMPPVVLTAIKIFNVERSFGMDISALTEITLSHRDRLLEFDFAALDYANIERVQYAYMMEGIDREFVSFGTRHFATYTNLPAGEYTFRVRATNADGIWNAQELTLRVIIVPPFWETWWFRLAIFLVFCGVIWGSVRLRLKRSARRNALLREEVRKRTQELEASNQELAWSNERLQELNNEKNAILGIAAHDLKTPLATMLTLTELVENDRNTLSSEELHHFNSLMRQSANRMMSLITQLLNMNMIDEGKLNLSLETIEVNPIISALCADAEALARPKNLTFHITKPQENYHICADHSAYMQIIENLLSNAIKYSPLSKNIWVELGIITKERSEYVCFSVRDEGIGLTEDDKKRLFGKFARLSARPTGGEHSTGLGLSIVKKLVEAMNGEIWCESEHRKGATFFVAFPCISAHNTANIQIQ